MASDSGFVDEHYSASDGLKLHARVYGESQRGRWPVICLPGLTRNARDFHELALYLSTRKDNPRKIVAFDYRGRGGSEYDRDWKNYTVATEAADVVAGLIALGIEHGAFIGTSRGGLIIQVLTAIRPAVVKAVILNDIGPVVEGVGLAHIRSYLERAPKPKTIADAVAIQKSTHGQAFSALGEADWQRMTEAIYKQTKGRLVADYDRKLVKTVTAVDLTRPLPVLWPQFEGLVALPLMVIRGENSKLLSAETVAEMGRRHPSMDSITVEGQGHPPMLETGDLPARIAAFIDRAEAAR